MEVDERINKNVLIALFMGATKDGREYKIPSIRIPYQGYEKYGDCEPCLKFTDTCNDYEMKYHESWDWIMPVIDKISEVCSKDHSAEHYYWNTTTDIRIFREPIDVVFTEVAKFIEWYNNHTK